MNSTLNNGVGHPQGRALIKLFTMCVLVLGVSGCSERQASIVTDRTKHDAAVLMEVKQEIGFLNEDLGRDYYQDPERRLKRLEVFHGKVWNLCFPAAQSTATATNSVLVRGVVVGIHGDSLWVRCDYGGDAKIVRERGVLVQRGHVGLKGGQGVGIGQTFSVWASDPEPMFYTNKFGEIRQGITYRQFADAG